MATRTLVLRQWDGANDGWSASLPLKSWPEPDIVVDASAVRFATPTFLLRLRSFVEWHGRAGRPVTVLAPRNRQVANYMARMRVAHDLAAGGFVDLPTVRERERGDVLIPVSRLQSAQDVDAFNEAIAALIRGHAQDVAVLEDALTMAISELCGNAVEHGANPLGCYVSAQRYPARRTTVLAIGDLGAGIPQTIRSHFPDVRGDPQAIEHALEEGVTTTGRPTRGQGFYWVLEAARHSHVRGGVLDVRAGRGHLVRELTRARTLLTSVRAAPNKRGTWVTLELGPKS